MRRSYNDHATSIKDLFAVYRKRLRAPQKSVIKEVVVVVRGVVPVEVTEKYFSYNVHTRTVTIHAPSVLKTEILQRKKDILHQLQERLGQQNTPTTIL